MKFFADENVARPIIQWLRLAGHDVLSGAEAGPGEDDAVWLRRAQESERVIVTSDKDFGELIFRDRLNSHGIVLIRTQKLSLRERLARLAAVWSTVEANPQGKFIVITEGRVRVRSLKPPDEDRISHDALE
jgi:predicted nuclease of predicted toxin-antitoxin system